MAVDAIDDDFAVDIVFDGFAVDEIDNDFAVNDTAAVVEVTALAPCSCVSAWKGGALVDALADEFEVRLTLASLAAADVAAPW